MKRRTCSSMYLPSWKSTSVADSPERTGTFLEKQPTHGRRGAPLQVASESFGLAKGDEFLAWWATAAVAHFSTPQGWSRDKGKIWIVLVRLLYGFKIFWKPSFADDLPDFWHFQKPSVRLRKTLQTPTHPYFRGLGHLPQERVRKALLEKILGDSHVWLSVKKGYLKKPIGKRINEPKPMVL